MLPTHLGKHLIRHIRGSMEYVDQLDTRTQAIVRSSYEKALLAAFVFAAVLSLCAAICSVFIEEKPIDRK